MAKIARQRAAAAAVADMYAALERRVRLLEEIILEAPAPAADAAPAMTAAPARRRR